MRNDHHDPRENLGGLVISAEVLASIALTAARDIEGVSVVVPRAVDLKRLFKRSLRYVKIAGNDTEMEVELMLRLCAGARLIAVSGKVQRAVKEALQGMTGRTVARVNLKIQGIDY